MGKASNSIIIITLSATLFLTSIAHLQTRRVCKTNQACWHSVWAAPHAVAPSDCTTLSCPSRFRPCATHLALHTSAHKVATGRCTQSFRLSHECAQPTKLAHRRSSTSAPVPAALGTPSHRTRRLGSNRGAGCSSSCAKAATSHRPPAERQPHDQHWTGSNAAANKPPCT